MTTFTSTPGFQITADGAGISLWIAHDDDHISQLVFTRDGATRMASALLTAVVEHRDGHLDPI
jgi:hypothetical protein